MGEFLDNFFLQIVIFSSCNLKIATVTKLRISQVKNRLIFLKKIQTQWQWLFFKDKVEKWLIGSISTNFFACSSRSYFLLFKNNNNNNTQGRRMKNRERNYKVENCASTNKVKIRITDQLSYRDSSYRTGLTKLYTNNICKEPTQITSISPD